MTDLRNQEAIAAAERAAKYEWGFTSEVEQDFAPKGLSEDTDSLHLGQEGRARMDARMAPQGLSRLADHGGGRPGPSSAIPPIDFQDAYYYAEPKAKPKLGSLDEVDPEILRVYEKLGIPIEEQKVLAGVEGARKVAVDAVFDSVQRRHHLPRGASRRPASSSSRSPRRSASIPIWCSKWLGSVVPQRDNYFACLNSAVFSDGTFVYVPEGVRCPMELSTYFRINAENTGQFERTLIVADKGSYVSYLEGCTAPMRDENQLHAAVVELVALDDAEIKYSTVQNWYPGDAEGKGGIYNFVTKRGACRGARSKISWTQVETGSAITWKYPSLHPPGRRQRRRILFGRAHQQFPAGRYRHQDDPYRQEQPLDDHLQGDQRRQVEQHLSRPRPRARQCRERPQFHPVRFAAARRANAAPTPCPTSRSRTRRRRSSTRRPPSKISDDQLFYAMQRGLRAGGSGRPHRQRLRPRGAEAAADGVRGRGAEAAGDQPEGSVG